MATALIGYKMSVLFYIKYSTIETHWETVKEGCKSKYGILAISMIDILYFDTTLCDYE